MSDRGSVMGASSPTVTVVIPTKRAGERLQQAVASVAAQTYADFRCIIVDDGSGAASIEIPDDPRFELTRLERNGGVAQARNLAVATADSPYVAFLDDDDAWLPQKLELQIAAFAEVPDAVVSYTEFLWTFPDGTVIDTSTQAVHPLSYLELLAEGMFHMSSVMVRREAYLLVGGCNPNLTLAQDHDLMLKLLRLGHPVAWVPSSLTVYNVWDGNSTNAYQAATEFRADVLRQHAKRAMLRGEADVVAACAAGLRRTRELAAFQAILTARASYRSEGWAAALGHLSYGSRRDPRVVGRHLRKAGVLRLKRGVGRL